MNDKNEMSTRRKKIPANRRTKLNEEDINTAAARWMAAAQAHQRASVYCMDKPDAKPPNIDSFFFSVVSLEMILLSVEQSLRLLLLLHYGIIRDDTNHTPRVLYQTMLRKSGGENSAIRKGIITHTNAIGSLREIPQTTEQEVVSTLNRHNSSYTNFRYFQLNKQGKLNSDFGFMGREVQILHTLALALISLNVKEMDRRKIPMYSSMSVVPESEMTDELRALKEAMIS